MNNEIEQIAQQNDMGIEFVRWFFNEKKADCGEQWFLALGAMWEGWKAREGEATALALTLEKSREASGCPAGVDLQDWVKMLVSELSVVEEIHNSAVFITDELYDASPKEVQGIIRSLACMKMPAYARLVAGIKADGRVEGANFVANRMLAAWDAGFIEDSAKNAADIARMILTSTEFMADAPEGDFDRSFADGILEDIAKQLREGADK
ncbi:ead/Ea22-like family protein [Klebsiella aerogenes]|uniref:ead/Ea22-like family protein n=1 Tax=Klebsiella aerogenes TaxID=548 RepID=UPI002FF16F33